MLLNNDIPRQGLDLARLNKLYCFSSCIPYFSSTYKIITDYPSAEIVLINKELEYSLFIVKHDIIISLFFNNERHFVVVAYCPPSETVSNIILGNNFFMNHNDKIIIMCAFLVTVPPLQYFYKNHYIK